MTRLIDADDLKDLSYINKGNFNSVEGIWKWIDNAPTVEVGYLTNCANCERVEKIRAKRPHGKWSECFDKKTYFIGWKCSRCEKICKGIYNFCPNCGAKMEVDNV